MRAAARRTTHLGPHRRTAIASAILVSYLLLLSAAQAPGVGPAPRPVHSEATGGSTPPAAPPPALWPSTGSAQLARGSGAPAAPIGLSTGPQASTLTWSNLTGVQRLSPPPLRGASLTYNPTSQDLLMFGGCEPSACPAPATTEIYSGGQWSNASIAGTQPPARSYASMTYDSRDGYVLLYGGIGSGGRVLNDTWAFVGGGWVNLTNPGSAPPARWGAALSFDHAGGFTVLFGGASAGGAPLNDTWGYTQAGWQNNTSRAGSAPTARWGAGFVWDEADGYALLFGGSSGAAGPLNDTWEYVGAHWAKVAVLSPASPPARSGPFLSYFGITSTAVLFGGNGTRGPLSDTWRYGAARWTNLTGQTGATPSGRFAAAAMESTSTWPSGTLSRTGFLLMFGGASSGCPTCPGGGGVSDTWVFEPKLLAMASVLPSVVEVGQPASFAGSGSGGTPPYIYRWTLGDNSSTSLQNLAHPYSATGGYTATLVVTDAAGVPANATTSVTVLPGPSVGVSITPRATDVGRTSQFNASASGGTPPYGFAWALGDASTASGTSVAHAFAAPGTYSGNVTATDSVRGVGWATFVATVNPRLSLVASAPGGDVVSGAASTFSSTVAGGTPPIVVRWSFGDSSSSAVASTTHVYNRSGSYPVTVSVSDAAGESSSQNFTVIVVAAPGGSHGGFVLTTTELEWLVGAAVALGVAAVGLFAWRRRRAHRSDAAAPIAGAAAGQEPWENPRPSDSRDSREARRRLIRR